MGRGIQYVLGVGLLVVLTAGCARPDAPDSSVLGLAAQRDASVVAAPQLSVNPPDGSAGVSPTETVTATVTGGQLTQVALTTADGAALTGALSPDGERWASSQPLKPDTSYVLRVGSRGISGDESTTTARFSTLAPGQQVAGKITPTDSEAVAGDRPVSVLFDKPIADRGAVERALRVSANPVVAGASSWPSDRELVWVPKSGWAPGSQVTVTLDIFGKQLGGGLVGAADLRTAFSVVDKAGAPLQLRAPSSSAPPSSARPSTPKPSTPKPSVAARSAAPRPLVARPSASARSGTSSTSGRSGGAEGSGSTGSSSRGSSSRGSGSTGSGSTGSGSEGSSDQSSGDRSSTP